MFRRLAIVFVLACFSAYARKPNVVIILTDDQGSVDMKAYGADDLETPAMDGLAKRGVRFTQFYAAAPVCSPSRAGLLTGRTPQRAQLAGNVQLDSKGMPGSQVTIAEMLKAADYATGHIGKWHLGHHPETIPNGQGFDYSFGHLVGCIDNYSHFFYWAGPNKHDLWRNGERVYEDGKFFPDLMVEEASLFIDKNKDKPFFLYFALNTPHYPYQGEKKWLEHYKDLPYPRNLYAAFLSTQDTRIGQLLKKLDDSGVRDDTIVIFQSDHGHSTEERAHRGGGSSGPYRGAKFSLLEGGIRVPAIISWPGRLPEGAVRDQLATSCDWLPTIAALCQVELPQRKLDGKDISTLVKSSTAPSPHASFFWEMGSQWAVRQGDWKLLHKVVDTSAGKRKSAKGMQLFNIAKDPGEATDLAKTKPDVLAKLKALRDDWNKTKAAQ